MIFGSKHTKFSDEELVYKYKSTRHKKWVGVLFNRYAHLVFGVCLKYLKDRDDSKDASLEIFEELFDRLLKHEVRQFAPWLHTVSRNYCLMRIRKLKTQPTGQRGYDLNGISDDANELEDKVIQEAQIGALERALFKLNKEQQQCIQLFYLEKKSYQAVSDETGFDLKKVKSFIQNGKRNLKIILTEDGFER